MTDSNEHDVSVSVVSRSYSSLSQSTTEHNGEHHTELSSSQDLGESVDEQSTEHHSDEDVCAEFVRKQMGCHVAHSSQWSIILHFVPSQVY